MFEFLEKFPSEYIFLVAETVTINKEKFYVKISILNI